MNQEVDAQQELADKDSRTWAMLCHLSALSGFFIPLGNILGPLIIWAIKKDEFPYVDEQGKEAMNFQLTMSIAFIASLVLVFVIIGLFLLGILILYALVMIIIASVKTNDGVAFRYPHSIRFIK